MRAGDAHAARARLLDRELGGVVGHEVADAWLPPSMTVETGVWLTTRIGDGGSPPAISWHIANARLKPPKCAPRSSMSITWPAITAASCGVWPTRVKHRSMSARPAASSTCTVAIVSAMGKAHSSML